MPQFEIAEYGG